MAINIAASQAQRARRVSLGVGRLFIGPLGVTPATEVGFSRGASLAVTRTRLELKQGVPRTTVFQFVQEEEAILSFTGLEWHIDRLRDVLAVTNAVTGAAGNGGGALGFGGDVNLASVAVWFQHQMPSGATANIYMWAAQGQGELNLTFGDDFQEFPYAFKAIVSTTEWTNNTALSAQESLFRVQIQAPPGGF